MRTTGRATAAAAMAAMLACTGGTPVAEAPGSSPPAVKAGSPEEAAVMTAAGPGLRDAKMQVRTSWADGHLAAFCAGERCTTDPGAEPAGFVRARETRLLSFYVRRRPSGAAVEFARARSGTVIETKPLHPGTLMSVLAGVSPGRYVLTLRARWGEREARWLFGLVVPRDA